MSNNGLEHPLRKLARLLRHLKSKHARFRRKQREKSWKRPGAEYKED